MVIIKSQPIDKVIDFYPICNYLLKKDFDSNTPLYSYQNSNRWANVSRDIGNGATVFVSGTNLQLRCFTSWFYMSPPLDSNGLPNHNTVLHYHFEATISGNFLHISLKA